MNIEDPKKDSSLKEKIEFYFDDLDSPISRAINIIIVLMILTLCVTFVISTYQVPPLVSQVIWIIEHIIISIFIIEYLLRFWVAKDKFRHFFNVYSLIDLVSIIPILFLVFDNLQFMRIFRMLRLFRILRFLRYLKDDRIFLRKVDEDNLIIARIIFTVFAIIFVSSGLIFFEEKEAVGTKMHNFFDAVYFAIVTLTTVGYGDITPVTFEGRLVTILMILSGVTLLPWQLGILARKFLSQTGKKDIICKQCGLRHHEVDAVHCRACGEIIYNIRD